MSDVKNQTGKLEALTVIIWAVVSGDILHSSYTPCEGDHLLDELFAYAVIGKCLFVAAAFPP